MNKLAFSVISLTILASALHINAQEASGFEPVYADSVAIDEDLLDEVVVTASKPLVQIQSDKVTYNMEEDPTAQASSAIDAMRKVPMLSVDADGNIKLKGESNFKIYLNGKPDPSLSSNYKDILRAMPASSIRKIEVITDPGAKYDAEGVGGIINIITISRTKLDGYSATFTLSGGPKAISGGVNAMGRIGKVSLNLNYNHSYNMNNGMRQESSSIYYNNPIEHRYTTFAKFDMHNNFDFGSVQASWEPDSLNLFTVNGNIFSVGVPLNTHADYNMYTQEGSSLWSYKSKLLMDINYLNYTIGTNWQHNFSSPDHNIVLLYQYAHNRQRDYRTNIYEDYINYPQTIPGLHSEIEYPDNEHTFQADYTLPLQEKKHIIEAGAKYIMRRNFGTTRQFTSADGIEWILDPSESVDLTQHQDVAAVYGAYTGRYGALSAKGGIRYEYAHLSSKFHTPGHEDFSQDLNDIVPDAMLTYSLPDYSSIKLAYQMRITRPGMTELNPYKIQQTPLNVTYGNPELLSQKSNNVSLTYSNFTLPVQINFSASYTYTDKMILSYNFLGDDGISYTTYGNYGHCNQGALYTYLGYPIIPGMRLGINAGVNYADYKSGRVGVHNHGWGWNIGGDYSYEMPKDFTLSAYGGAGRANVNFQTQGSVWSYHGLGITKSLLPEKRLRITLSAMNFCTPKQHYTQTVLSDAMKITNKTTFNTWNVSLSVSYRIGSLTSGAKSTAKNVNNDDVMKSQSSTPGSMPSTQH